MKKILIISCLLIIVLFTYSTSYAFYESLPSDLGSNSNIMEIISPEDKETTSYTETYLISCTAEPGTEITLYERYDDTLFIPLLLDDEAITGTVGESGLFLVDLTLKPKSVNRIMFFAQKGNRYQTIFKTIYARENEAKEVIEYKILDIKDLAVPVNSN